MLFTTASYFLFFWTVFAVYWSLRKRQHRNSLILLASYAFYSWWDYRFAGLMIVSTFVDYFAAVAIEKSRPGFRRKCFLLLSLASNLSILFFFKYCNFFVDSFLELAAMVGIQSNFSTLNIILPLGISFYTFQTIGYTIDVYRNRIKPCANLLDYAAYVSFFPQLVAGPIERGANLIPQFRSIRTFSEPQCKDGLRLILWGLMKKLIVADNLATIVDTAYARSDTVGGASLLVATVCFAFQIYCDFSAYSDIARGSAKLLGFDLMRNFAFPYFSQSLAEFWRRWHISLSTWFRDYVYIPLGGSESGGNRWRINIIITFSVSGLWHGASFNFVVWGLLNGLGLLIFSGSSRLRHSDIPLGKPLFPSLRALAAALATFAFVSLTWVFFRSQNLEEAFLICGKIIAFPIKDGLGALEGANCVLAVSYIAPLVAVEFVSRQHQHPFALIEKIPRAIRWVAYFTCIALAFYFMPAAQSVFVYFQF